MTLPEPASGSLSLPRPLWGCDFTSAPSRRKPIVLAEGAWQTSRSGALRLQLQGFLTFDSLASFGQHLQCTSTWLGAFDLPFGLPRELVQCLGWPTKWDACMAHYTQLRREQVRASFVAFCQSRPVGGKFAHRQTDVPAGSSPSMKWVNPPVAFMMHAGIPLLQQAHAHMPGLMPPPDCEPARVALEAYPGWLARQVLGRRSYKSDNPVKHTADRLVARKEVLHALEMGHIAALSGLRCAARPALAEAMLADASGDRLDAWMCLIQAAWAQQQHQRGHACYGLPDCDPLEGWIVMVDQPTTPLPRLAQTGQSGFRAN